MKYHKQLINHDPKNGKYGDCFRTSIACILDKEPIEVPHFYDYDPETESDEVRDNAFNEVYKYLNNQGVHLIRLGWDEKDVDMKGVFNMCNHMFNGMIYLLSGKSETSLRVPCNHVVICQDDKMIHDVSNDHYGLIGACITGEWQAELLVRKP